MLDQKAVVAKLRKAKAKRVLVQFPEGLKTRVFETARLLEKSGFEVIVMVEPCFGACDLRDAEARRLGCDALLHIGHSDMGLHHLVPVVYDEYRMDFDPVKGLRRGLKMLRGFRTVGLVSAIQYNKSLAIAKGFLKKNRINALIGESGGLREGQVLGCNYSSAKSIESKVECFLFIGSGRFHPLGLLQSTDKPVFFLDAEKNELTDMSGERKRLEIKRRLRIEKARGMRNFGIFVSTKPGQFDIGSARHLKSMLDKKGRKALVIVADALTSEKLMGIGIEVLVNTACRRISDDQKSLGVIVLSPEDAEEL